MATKTLKLKLDTSYEKHGNSSGMQIDTLAIAVDGSDYNELTEYNIEHFDAVEQGAIECFNFEDTFIEHLKTMPRSYVKNLRDDAEAYDAALAEFKRELIDEARSYELDESHALAVAIQEARDEAEKDLRKEWIYGDYRGNFEGILKLANKRYAVEFTYDDASDTLTADIEDEEASELEEYGHVEDTSTHTLTQWLVNSIEGDAYTRHASELAKRKARREEAERVREYQKTRDAERALRVEAERKEKLDAVINSES